jgi:phosphoadenosine phosphosulfate reductase
MDAEGGAASDGLADPGLDRERLLALSSPRRDDAGIVARIRDHLAAHDGYVAFSGGKDSLVVLHLALQADPSVPVAFFDSGLEFPETYDFIGQLARDWGFGRQLHWISAEPSLLHVLHDTGACRLAGRWRARRTRAPGC